MARAIILSGADRYDGPWHDHPATSQRVAEVLADVGIDARIRAMHPRAFGELASADLVICNVANGTPGPEDRSDDEWIPAWEALRAYVARGGPLLALHLSAGALREVLEWPERNGVRVTGEYRLRRAGASNAAFSSMKGPMVRVPSFS